VLVPSGHEEEKVVDVRTISSKICHDKNYLEKEMSIFNAKVCLRKPQNVVLRRPTFAYIQVILLYKNPDMCEDLRNFAVIPVLLQVRTKWSSV